MKQLHTFIMLLVSIALSGFASAHPGHDHAHWSSALIHVFWLLPLLGVALFALRTRNLKGEKK